MAVISEAEIQFLRPSAVDKVGRVFAWKNDLFRAIYPEAAPQVRQFFSSGCLDALTRRGLFPESEITEHILAGFAFVVKHKTVPVVTYPHEWSFEMLRDAALAVLDITEIAKRHGWSLNDCRPCNILFHGVQPLYVDLGGFVPKTSHTESLPGASFLRLYWWPLSIWASGDHFLAQRIISGQHEKMASLRWRFYRNPLVRWFGLRPGARLARLWDRVTYGVARWLREGAILAQLVAPLSCYLSAETLIQNPTLLRRKLAKLAPPKPVSAWLSYHDEYMGTGKLVPSPRFDRISEIVYSLGSTSVVELAGNQGFLSLLLASRRQITRIICTDCDSDVINKLYSYCRRVAGTENNIIHPAVLDFMISESNSGTIPPAERFRADLVTALAITHHLTLRQNLPLREVIRAIASYTNRFALVEFMPLGLWDGWEAPPLPDWYGPDWFRVGFGEFFDILGVEQIETNRVLYLGVLK